MEKNTVGGWYKGGMILMMSFLLSHKKPPFFIDGLDAAKKKNDLARRHNKNHTG
jgi:hypothetical protein